jgi:hypothetical protein
MFYETLGNLIFGTIGNREDILFPFLCLPITSNKPAVLPSAEKKTFSFAVQNKFLQVKGNCLSNAEIFHVLGYLKFQFFADSEKVIHGITACENNSCIFGNINTLFAELLARKAFHAYEMRGNPTLSHAFWQDQNKVTFLFQGTS